MTTELFNLSEKIKNLFEVEYLDSMADVQGDVSKILKEFIRLLKEELRFTNLAQKNAKKIIDKLAGKSLC